MLLAYSSALTVPMSQPAKSLVPVACNWQGWRGGELEHKVDFAKIEDRRDVRIQAAIMDCSRTG